MKLNSDATMKLDKSGSGIGFLARDFRDKLLVAQALLNYFDDVLEFEAIALVQAIKFAIKQGWKKIEEETDSQSLFLGFQNFHFAFRKLNLVLCWLEGRYLPLIIWFYLL